MPILLTSNGITSQAIIDKYTELFNTGFKKVAIIVTADPEYREKNRKAVCTRKELENIGFHPDFFDIEFSSPSLLLKYDILFFIGGNPFYLLNQIQKTHTDNILYELISKGKIISGSSAGCVVLGETIALINEFDPQMNNGIGLTDFKGIGLTNINLCPHHTKYINRYDNFEERICLVEETLKIEITRINDGEALIIDNGQVIKI
ncbi:Type 1 glutamine amidotransferase-like domain-containing protein [Oceanirhabdus sp. W0125-5]|uniref:Type 1 glutamine amidotransferase-like domain-containing protein n=1 Tax=Oceanirhabdus sp. W0125-5 TaxID=2999116 RepID=UPI0022F2D0D6|nr:Type 1 glutamine amidotransferase-like domain-containing protein [Oceanirhabdus sp. W0125-5]WBW96793.1 Type 1 glutamine amidotransferase-like domain-containing protein [Oceanirhabdus sp. W0125-5]